jgi:hypothetical protein
MIRIRDTDILMVTGLARATCKHWLFIGIWNANRSFKKFYK